MNIGKKAVATCALVFSLTAPAAALSIPGLPALPTTPDICLWSYCISYTQSSFYTQIQSLYAQVRAATSNVGNVVGQSVMSEIGAITAQATASAPNAGVTAAQEVLTQAPLSAETIKQIDTDSQVADSAAGSEKVSTEYLSSIASGVAKNGAMAAQQVVQKHDENTANLTGMQQLFSGKEPASEQI
jgi:hypothetical protein